MQCDMTSYDVLWASNSISIYMYIYLSRAHARVREAGKYGCETSCGPAAVRKIKLGARVAQWIFKLVSYVCIVEYSL